MASAARSSACWSSRLVDKCDCSVGLIFLIFWHLLVYSFAGKFFLRIHVYDIHVRVRVPLWCGEAQAGREKCLKKKKLTLMQHFRDAVPVLFTPPAPLSLLALFLSFGLAWRDAAPAHLSSRATPAAWSPAVARQASLHSRARLLRRQRGSAACCPCTGAQGLAARARVRPFKIALPLSLASARDPPRGRGGVEREKGRSSRLLKASSFVRPPFRLCLFSAFFLPLAPSCRPTRWPRRSTFATHPVCALSKAG